MWHFRLAIGSLFACVPADNFLSASNVIPNSVGDSLGHFRCLGTPDQQVTPIDLLDHSSSLMLSLESILDSRTITRGAHQVLQFFIKWQGLPLEDATWEDSHSLRQRFPDFNFEDKVHLPEGGNVTNLQDHGATLRRSNRDKQPPKYLDQYVVPNAKQGPAVPVPVAPAAPGSAARSSAT
ncbi:uncharacterized protein LOC124891584 [Capsicum annuum]|uniref:uncharacterized protein LOC124891584 n=1 Tax=Capsicum annuum TaxID=4072 RepID=UPI001FB1648C|nr:uncharacterized protein LOC124891584 [Capsicum annuum]